VEPSLRAGSARRLVVVVGVFRVTGVTLPLAFEFPLQLVDASFELLDAVVRAAPKMSSMMTKMMSSSGPPGRPIWRANIPANVSPRL
jgi:hypothetical protein